MRLVTRGAVPKSLDGPASAGAKELERARAHFGAGSDKEFPFKAYKGPDVREALDRDFLRKCAYCETNIGATQPMDVEHYRPKGAVAEGGRLVKPGYWWLAAEWSNLLPSCIDCNRQRAQQIMGAEGATTVGKANQFPIAPGTARAGHEGGEAAEQALLLDPCTDDGTAHLEFMEDGNVRPRLVDGHESERGEATIEVVALRRKGLADRRMAVALTVAVAISHVEETLRDLNENEALPLPAQAKADRRAMLNDRLRQHVDELERHARPDAEYTAMAEEMIRAFKARIGL
ncbi:MAG: hypothetical protein AB1673_08535 [Actinomycetota bacterium]